MAAFFGVLVVLLLIVDLSLAPGSYWWRSKLHTFASCAFIIHLAIMPVLCGSLVFVEENHLRSRPWQLGLPVALSRQWLIKVATALVISAGLGLIMPLMFLLGVELVEAKGLMVTDWGVGAITGPISVHVLLFGLAAWCASWSRTTIGAIMKSFLFLIGLMVLTRILSYSPHHYVAFDWRVLAWPIAVTGLILTLSNFKAMEWSFRRRAFQIALVAAIAMAVTM
jgi:hypothetical protein